MKKKKDHYDLNCIDHVTKYITAHLFVEKRTLPKCKEFLSEVKETCYDQIIVQYKKEKHKKARDKKLVTFVCDGFDNYKNAFNKLFLYTAKLRFGVPIKAKTAGLTHNNNPIERENGNIKDRLKVMRGGFGSFEGAQGFLNMRRVIHNFVNPHQSLKGKTPAEAAEINLKLDRAKLVGLIGKRAGKIHHSRR